MVSGRDRPYAACVGLWGSADRGLVGVGMGGLRRSAATTAATAVGLAATVLILTTPWLGFGVRSPSGHLVLDSLDAFVGCLVAFLVYGRFLRSHRLQDLLFSQGLGMLVVAGLGLAHLSGLATGVRPGTLDVWLPLSVRVFGAALIAAGALLPTRCVQEGPWQRWLWAPPLAIVVAAATTLWVARSRLPVALDRVDVPTSAHHPILTGHPLLLSAQALSALCFFVAAIAFTSQSLRTDDELLRWLGPACALAAF